MIAVVVSVGWAITYWSLILAVVVGIDLIAYLELRGVASEAPGDTISATVWWLRDHYRFLFDVLMAAIVLTSLVLAAAVVLTYVWLMPHFFFGGS